MDQDLLNSSPTTPLCNGAVEAAPASEDGNFRTVADYANDGILVLMSDGRYVYANPKASQITGYSIDEIRAMGMPGLMHPDELPDTWVRLRKRLKGKNFPSPYEAAIVDKAGRTVLIEVIGIKTLWGSEPADLVVFRDITVQKAAQQKIAEQERTFREIAEKIPGAVFQVVLRKDKSFSFLYMSERFQRVFGYDPEAIEGDAALMFKLVPREDLVRNRKIMFESARTLQTYELEHRTVSPDGHVRWYHVSGTPRRLPSDETLWNGVAIDVTDMKSVEQALQAERDKLEIRVRERTEELTQLNQLLQREIASRIQAEAAQKEAKERYLRFLEFSPDPIVVYDMDGNTVYINPAFASTFGWTAAELLGKRIDFVPEEEWPATHSAIDRMLAGATAQQFDTVRLSKEGRKIPIHLSSARLDGPDGRPAGKIVILRDVTELSAAHGALKSREEELAASNRELQEVNAALRVLLKKRASDRSDLEKKVAHNIRELVLPNLERLKRTSLTRKQALCTELLEFNLAEVAAPFTHTLSWQGKGLTPAEIQMTNLVKLGRRTKEIAEMLNVSPKTVETHRKSIRKKLGIRNKSVNLRTYLIFLDT